MRSILPSKKFGITTAIILFSILNTLQAQTDVDLDPDFGGRLSFELDKKISRGLHLAMEEELRMDDKFQSFDRFHTTLSLSYKVHPSIKVGIGYALINAYSDSAFKAPRHRLMVDASYSLRFGDWRISLKERFQATRRTGDMNEYQNPRTALTLKSRLKLQYKGLRTWEPYLSLELRNMLNAPTINAYYDGTNYLTESGSKKGEAGWFLGGFNKCYVNRLRGTLGSEVQLTRNSSINLYLIADYNSDYVVDANAEGTKLKSYTHETGFVTWLCAGYRYAF